VSALLPESGTSNLGMIDMAEITNDLLRTVCAPPFTPKRAYDACKALGVLGKWWLRPETLRAAHQYNSNFPSLTAPPNINDLGGPGSCWVVLRLSPKTDLAELQLPLLRQAFLLPLRWELGPHSPHLPAELKSLGDRVVESLHEYLRPDRSWGLHLADLPKMDRVCLGQGLKFSWDSAWAALAGGLITHDLGLHPDPGVWASGAWKHHGLAHIDGLAEKLALAAEWKAKVFFVPAWQQDEARSWVDKEATDQLDLGALAAPAEPDAFATLNHYLARLAKVPPRPEGEGREEEQAFQRCKEYYRIQIDSDQTRAFYWSHLLQPITRRVREKYRKLPVSKTFTHLITIVSPSNELAVLAPLVVQAKHCLLLYTPDLLPQARECEKHLPGVRCKFAWFHQGPDQDRHMADAVEAFTSNVPVDEVVLDLTPGTKMMSYSLSRTAKAGNWLFFLDAKYLHDRSAHRRPDPDSESPDLRPVRTETGKGAPTR
jgi:hypothetical protein